MLFYELKDPPARLKRHAYYQHDTGALTLFTQHTREFLVSICGFADPSPLSEGRPMAEESHIDCKACRTQLRR